MIVWCVCVCVCLFVCVCVWDLLAQLRRQINFIMWPVHNSCRKQNSIKLNIKAYAFSFINVSSQIKFIFGDFVSYQSCFPLTILSNWNPYWLSCYAGYRIRQVIIVGSCGIFNLLTRCVWCNLDRVPVVVHLCCSSRARFLFCVYVLWLYFVSDWVHSFSLFYAMC